MNISDSERVVRVLHENGFRQAEREEDAQLLGILSCSVRQKAIDKVYSRISRWNKWKNKKSLLTFVTGCILPEDREKFLKLFDLVFPVSELNEFPEMLRQYGVVTSFSHQHREHVKPTPLPSMTPSPAVIWKGMKEMNIHIEEFWDIRPEYESDFEAYVPIQNGCDKFCTFCAVPYTRGREVSRSSAEILEEVDKLVQNDYKSITLLGQNVNSYGLDKKGEELNFAQLLREIGEIGIRSGKEFWVYFTSPHPRDMSFEVIDIIAQYPCLARQIHLPLQSGDDQVLIRMNRKHSVAKYLEIANYIREKIPQVTLFTDIIVGFTGETDAQFENTKKIMELLKFNMAYIAMYSPRPGAASSRWEDDVPIQKKKERLHILSETLRKYAYEYNKQLIGQKVKVLVTGRDRKTGYLSGHTEGRIVVRFPSDNEYLIGKIIDLEITSASELSVEGALVYEKV